MLFKKILPHLCIILGGMFLVFVIINHFNDAMNFIANEISLVLLFIWSILSMVMGGVYIADMRKNKKNSTNVRSKRY